MLPEDALKIYQAGQQIVVETLCELCDTVECLNDKVHKLEEQVAGLSKNSSNSGKRPSSDDVTKPKKKNKGKKRKIGAQPGHKGNFRDPFTQDEIDDFFDYHLTECPICNGQVLPADGYPRVIQQMEISETPVFKYEHRTYPVWCDNCKKVHYMPFPEVIVKGNYSPLLA